MIRVTIPQGFCKDNILDENVKIIKIVPGLK
jgi:hypothetical protein